MYISKKQMQKRELFSCISQKKFIKQRVSRKKKGNDVEIIINGATMENGEIIGDELLSALRKSKLRQELSYHIVIKNLEVF